jgi:hypothetical protein
MQEEFSKVSFNAPKLLMTASQVAEAVTYDGLTVRHRPLHTLQSDGAVGSHQDEQQAQGDV